MGSNSAALGADLYDLWNAGTNTLPDAAKQYDAAWEKVPYNINSECMRSGPIGIVPDGPAPAINSLISALNDALSQTSSNLKATGEALVWLANEYAKTDAAAKAEFDRKKKDMGGN